MLCVNPETLDRCRADFELLFEDWSGHVSARPIPQRAARSDVATAWADALPRLAWHLVTRVVPRQLAPHGVHLVGWQVEKREVREAAEALVGELESAGLSVLYDDREESPGVKFNDADLLGMPLRVTVSPRNLDKGSVELRLRAGDENELVARDAAVAEIKARLASD